MWFLELNPVAIVAFGNGFNLNYSVCEKYSQLAKTPKNGIIELPQNTRWLWRPIILFSGTYWLYDEFDRDNVIKTGVSRIAQKLISMSWDVEVKVVYFANIIEQITKQNAIEA